MSLNEHQERAIAHSFAAMTALIVGAMEALTEGATLTVAQRSAFDFVLMSQAAVNTLALDGLKQTRIIAPPTEPVGEKDG